MRAPPFQVTWNVSLGGRAQDLRAAKISARGCDLTDRSSKRLPQTAGKKKPRPMSGLFGFGCGLVFFALGECQRQTGHLARVV